MAETHGLYIGAVLSATVSVIWSLDCILLVKPKVIYLTSTTDKAFVAAGAPLFGTVYHHVTEMRTYCTVSSGSR